MLVKAHQFAHHTPLPNIVKFPRFKNKKLRAQLLKATETQEDTTNCDREDLQQLAGWRNRLAINEQWRSTRVNAILECVVREQYLDPHCKIVIMDKCVFFLNIHGQALLQPRHPLTCLRCDGRKMAEPRDAIIKEFDNAPNTGSDPCVYSGWWNGTQHSHGQRDDPLWSHVEE